MSGNVALRQSGEGRDTYVEARLYSVGDLAAETGVTHRPLRLYEDQGLLAPQRIGNRRIYSHRDRARLIVVLRGKRLGFSLADIPEMLELYEFDPRISNRCASPCPTSGIGGGAGGESAREKLRWGGPACNLAR